MSNPSSNAMKSISTQYSPDQSGIVLLVKRLLLVPVIMLAANAHADRLVNIPTGTKIHKNTLRLESLSKLGGGPQRRYYLGVPLGEVFDAQFIVDRDGPGRRDRLSLDASYNAFVPIPDIAPGISLGVRDLTNTTHDGRAIYLAVTNKFSQDGPYNMETPAEVTWGVERAAFAEDFLACRCRLRTNSALLPSTIHSASPQELTSGLGGIYRSSGCFGSTRLCFTFRYSCASDLHAFRDAQRGDSLTQLFRERFFRILITAVCGDLVVGERFAESDRDAATLGLGLALRQGNMGSDDAYRQDLACVRLAIMAIPAAIGDMVTPSPRVPSGKMSTACPELEQLNGFANRLGVVFTAPHGKRPQAPNQRTEQERPKQFLFGHVKSLRAEVRKPPPADPGG